MDRDRLTMTSHRSRTLITGSRAGLFRLLALWSFPLLFLALFYFYPLGSILRTSFSRSSIAAGSVITEVLQTIYFQEILWFTIWQAFLSTLLTLMIGLPGAFLLARYEFRGKSLLQALSVIPFVLPTVVVAAAFYALLGPRGWINLALIEFFDLSLPPIRFTNTLAAILLAHVFYNTTIILRMVGDYWSHLDPRMTQAARSLGANRWQTFRQITLPLLAPSIITSSLLVFLFDFTSFGVILILGGPRFATLEVEIYYQTISLFNLPVAATLSIIQLAFTLFFTFFYTRLSNRLARPLNLRPRTFTRKHLDTWRSRIFAGIMITILLVLLTAPLIALAARSVTRLEPDRGQLTQTKRGLTLDFYKELSINRRNSLFYVAPATAIGISLGYAILTVFLALGIGLPAAYALSRYSRTPLTNLLDPVIMLPLGTSAVTLGLGFILALSRPPLDLRTSPWMVPIAHTLVAFPFVVRSLIPSLRSIQPRLRHAAALLGASPTQVLRAIELPLVGRALLVAATFAFTISLGEFGATALIARPEYPTVPLVIYRYISQPGALNYGQALALSTILMLVTAVCILAIERLRFADIGEF